MAPRRKAPRRRAKKTFNISAIEAGTALSLMQSTGAASALEQAMQGNIKGSLQTLENVVNFMKLLLEAKLMIVKKMDQAKGLAKTFVRVPDGLKVVAPEGYVAIDKSGGAVKIVDKMEFSFNNFTVAKTWDK